MSTKTPSLPNILVVDDTAENLRLLASMLGAQGYEVRPVTNGRQALQAVERDPPDLVLLDINMPEMNGYEVCAALKARERSRDVPVIFLTALGDVSDKVRAFEVGGVDYVTKPFQVEEVLARVRTHVALRHARRDLEQSYTRLRELEKLRDDLVHMVVHDMRSPLMVMLGHLQLLRESSKAVLGENISDLEAAAQSARALTRLASDLLDVSRLEDGKLPLDRAPHDVGALAAEVGRSLGVLDRERTIELEIGPLPPVNCDAGIVRRVLENLIGNAVKHTPAGARVKIAVGAGRRCARIRVIDAGPGVPPEARTRVFDKFETLAARKDQRYHSAGLGLAFCKLAVEAHGGRIGIESAEPNGSIFWFELPL
jgi:two-component system, sensor histidine kinase and response regulator